MADKSLDYFKSKKHNDLCLSAIEEERKRVHGIMVKDGVMPAVSLCIAMISAYPSFMKTMGLEDAVIEIMEDIIKSMKEEKKE